MKRKMKIRKMERRKNKDTWREIHEFFKEKKGGQGEK